MDTETEPLSLRELGALLVQNRRAIDTAEAAWLAQLVEFDRRCGWVLDGHDNCVSWLVDRCGLARSTAFERLRIAHELVRRPVLAEAFADGRVSMSKIRILTRILDMGDDCDRAFVVAAQVATAKDMQRLYQHWWLLKQQETPVPETHRWDRCGMQTLSHNNGVATVELRVPDEAEQRLVRILDLAVEAIDGEAGEQSPVETVPQAQPTWTQRRAQALLEVLEAGLAHLAANGEVDVERALMHVLSDYDVLANKVAGTAELDGGIPISAETARRLACDAGLARIITKGPSEVLDVGRKTRHWTTAQRRAIRFRWGGRCAFPGCERRITENHHADPWGDEGPTDLTNGVPLCCHHHDLVHEGGWTVTYDPNQRAAIFTGPHDEVVIAPTPGALRWAA